MADERTPTEMTKPVKLPPPLPPRPIPVPPPDLIAENPDEFEFSETEQVLFAALCEIIKQDGELPRPDTEDDEPDDDAPDEGFLTRTDVAPATGN